MTTMLAYVALFLVQPNSVPDEIVQLAVQEPVTAIAWHPDGKRLFFATEKVIGEWPSNRRLRIPEEANEYVVVREPSQILFSRDGNKLLAFGSYTEVLHVLDLRRWTIRRVVGDCQTAWWAGSALARIRPYVNKRGWQYKQYLQIGDRRRDLPQKFRFTAVDARGEVLLAKEKATNGHIALYRLEPKSLAVRMFRNHREPSYVEYTERDSIAWNGRLRIAGIGLTCDTGASNSDLHFSSPGILTKYRKSEMNFIEGKPQGIGDKLLLILREFRENSAGGSDTYRIFLIEPANNSSKVLVSQVDSWRDLGSGRTEPDRATSPSIVAAAMSPDGKKLAWVIQTKAKAILTIHSYRQ